MSKSLRCQEEKAIKEEKGKVVVAPDRIRITIKKSKCVS